MTPAGWYHDPYGTPGLLRWWDGQQWGEATRPAGQEQAVWPGGHTPPASALPEPQRTSGQAGPATQAWAPADPTPPAQSSPATGGATPDGWAAGGSGGADGVQPVWARSVPAPPAETSRSRAPLFILGGGAVTVIAIIVVIVVLVTRGGSESGAKSPVMATISDIQAGLIYPRLGGAWHTETVNSTGTLAKLGFGQGQSATVMENYEGGQPYVASVYSGVVTDAPSGSLEAAAKAVIASLEPVAYPAHTRRDLLSASHPVDGHPGWLVTVRLTFPQAKSHNWNFHSERVAMLLVDRGNGRSPAEFYISIPDSHKNQGDLDLLLSSLKVS